MGAVCAEAVCEAAAQSSDPHRHRCPPQFAAACEALGFDLYPEDFLEAEAEDLDALREELTKVG